MQIPAPTTALPPAVPAALAFAARVLSGNLAALPLGAQLRATVTSVSGRDATLAVNGQTIAVRTPPGVQLQPGAAVLVRVPPGAATASNPSLDLIGTPPAPAAPPGGDRPAPQAAPPTPAGTPPTAPQGAGRPGDTYTATPPDGTAPETAAPQGAARPVDTYTANTTDGAPLPASTRTAPPAIPSPGIDTATVGRTAVAASAAADPSSPAAAPARAAATTPPAGTLGSQPRLAVVDVLAALSGGRVQVSVDGTEQTATAATNEPLVAGGRYVLQVQSTPTGTVLNPPPEGTAGTTEIATALLRVPAPELGATIEPLRTELAALANPEPGAAAPAPDAVRTAAAAVSKTLETFVPSDPRPPNATELQNLVENGGQHFEAKLARLVAEASLPASATPSAPVGTAPRTTATDIGSERTASAASPAGVAPAAEKPAASGARGELTGDQQPAPEEPTANESPAGRSAPTPDRTANPTAGVVGSDLKGDLLRLLQAVKEFGGVAAAPAAEGALHGIESQQAAQALAQAGGTPYYLQIPFPDGGQWRTLHLALEPQTRPDDPNGDEPGRFRVFMHVPLTDLGETWIDAGLSGTRFRATIYLDHPAVRDRVRAALGELGTELKADGFSEVLLDVRASSDLPAGRRRESGALVAGRPDTVSILDVRV